MAGIAVVTVSDRCSAGTQVDTAGPVVERLLSPLLASIQDRQPGEAIWRGLVPDEEEAIAALLLDLCRSDYALVVTVGGTGLGPRDVTPEATRRVIEREVPGLVEAMRATCAATYRYAWLSRAVAGLRGRTLMVNVPGSERGAFESIEAVLPLLPHALEILGGSGAHPPHSSSAQDS